MKIEDLTAEQREKLTEFGVNVWFVMELLEDYLNNPDSVAEDWRKLFESLDIKANGKEPEPLKQSFLLKGNFCFTHCPAKDQSSSAA